jgi:ATP adenylyltransferase
MDALFAPWRMDWVTRDRPDRGDSSDCVFCALPERDNDANSLIVARSGQAYVLLNNMPYNPGHVMVIPFEHNGDVCSVSTEALFECVLLVKEVIAASDKSLSPDGFNVGMNLGSAGGASIEDHLHIHVIPRWHSDTSFMPLTANSAIVEEAVEETYDRLRDGLLTRDAASGSLGGESVSFDFSIH